ncbi:adenine phosphoribosyltransferase [Maribacter sp. MJ134]|uniref:adenine phosphoribosyltransferase n=1 Tax=Maribacter sp. MJ134 TaxID=2496865 RepID=UPI000F83D3DE|nr:adenine phosphoribosyltransferase [Maribacter sp. MJ134]AZQ58839.1 adenine phosphoribosyltransferase [Maribacter sp. MJ134]
MNIDSYVRDVPDFPKKGIVFKDITPLLKDKRALTYTSAALSDLLKGTSVDIVVGMESRGFIFGPMLAEKLGAGFVPVRKPGKLPSNTINESFSLEYGSDTLEIHIDAIKKGDKVLIHDDVIATGGTAKAACKLVERLGGEVVRLNFLIELEFLNGREQLQEYTIQSLLKY